MTDDQLTSARIIRRPALITVAVVFAYVSGFGNIAIGILIILSRYEQVDDARVVFVSLLGAAWTLIGLLTIALASGLARGSRLARLFITIYFGIQLALHALTILTDTTLTWSAVVQLAAEAFIIVVVWTPPGSRFYRRVTAPDAAADVVPGAASTGI